MSNDEFVGWLDDEWNTVLDSAQPIVRCRDCVKWDYDSHGPKKFCFNFSDPEDGFYIATEPDGFCKWGELDGDAQ